MVTLDISESASSSTTLRPLQDDVASLEAASRSDLSDSIGTLLSGLQLSVLPPQQLDQLASLVANRGVVIFQDQNFDAAAHDRIIAHFDPTSPSDTKNVKESQGSDTHVALVQAHDEWHTDASYESEPPSFSLMRIVEANRSLGETSWVSQYGTYDMLSKPLQRFVDELTTVHVSGQQTTENPAVRTHPVTKLRALNVTPEGVTRFSELKKKESDKVLELLDYEIQSSAEHTVRWKWKSGDIAMWDNRCTAYRHISNSSAIEKFGVKSSFLREKPYFDLTSESRSAHTSRLETEAKGERERIEQIKARYNNTPLRRIIARQLSRDVILVQPLQAPDGKREIRSPVDSVISEQDAAIIPRSAVSGNRQQRTEEWASKMDDNLKALEKRDVPVRKNNTPLRRILERQLSASLERRLQWS